MQKEKTNSGKTGTGLHLRLSSKLTMLTKVLTLLVGIPVSALIVFRTNYSWWGDILGLLCGALSVAFAYLAVDAHLTGNDFLITGLFETQKRVNLSAIQEIKKFKSRGQSYYVTPNEKFLIMCPLFGDGRKVLYKLYNEFKENPQRVRASFLK